MNTVAFYDTKPYDREYFERAPEANRLCRQFHDFRLTTETAASVDGAPDFIAGCGIRSSIHFTTG